MNLTSSIKRAPKWAWYTAGGLGVAAAGVKVWKNRGGKGDEPIENVPGQEVGENSPGGYSGGYVGGGGAPGVIVPPVIIPQQNNDNGGLAGLTELYMDGVGSVFSAWENLLGPVMGSQQQLLMGSFDTIQQLALAGGAPQSVGIPVVSQPPIPQQIPVTIMPSPGVPVAILSPTTVWGGVYATHPDTPDHT